MTRGRPPLGAGHVERLEGAPLSKQRLGLILRTLSGELTVDEACAEMGVVDRLRPEARRDLGPGPAPPTQVDRVAITRALIERDYLQLRRRRFTLSITQRAVRNFK